MSDSVLPGDAGSGASSGAIAGHGRALREDGWTLLPSLVPAAFVTRLAQELDAAYRDQRALQLRNGVGDGADGTVHHLPCAGGAFLELLEEDQDRRCSDSFSRARTS